MLARMYHFARLVAVVFALSSIDRPALLHTSPAGEDESAKLSPEVRLRKLHLVRPDLIPYPISYDIYC